MIGPGAFWSTLRRYIADEKKSLSEVLSNGHVPNMEEYRDVVGQIKALDGVLSKASKILGSEDEKPKQEQEEENFA